MVDDIVKLYNKKAANDNCPQAGSELIHAGDTIPLWGPHFGKIKNRQHGDFSCAPKEIPYIRIIQSREGKQVYCADKFRKEKPGGCFIGHCAN
jgi:hypothetical protein